MARKHLCSLTQRYQGAENREDLADVKAQWAIAMRPGRLKELNKHPRQSGAPVSDHQTSVWLCEGAVQGAAQERQPTGDVVYAGGSVSRGPDDTGMG